MGGSKKTTVKQDQTQTFNQASSSTATAPGTAPSVAQLPSFEDAFARAKEAQQQLGETDFIANAGSGRWTGPTTVENPAWTGPYSSGPQAYEGQYFAEDPNYTGQRTVRDARWTEPSYAAGTGGEREAALGLQDYARGLIPGVGATVNSGLNWAQQVAAAGNDPNNPILQNYIAAMQQDAQEGFARSSANFRDEAIFSGAYAGTPFARQQTEMQDAFQENWNNTLAATYKDWYDQQQATLMGLPGYLSSLTSAGTNPYSYLASGGAAERGLNQIDIDNAMAAYAAQKGNEQDLLDETQANYEAGKLNEQEGIKQNLAAFEAGRVNREASLQDQISQYLAGRTNAGAALVNERGTFEASQANAQDILDNLRSKLNQKALGELGLYGDYFGTLASIPGQSLSSTNKGTQTLTGTTTTKQSVSPLEQAIGAAGAVANLIGAVKGVGGGGAQQSVQYAPAGQPASMSPIPGAQTASYSTPGYYPGYTSGTPGTVGAPATPMAQVPGYTPNLATPGYYPGYTPPTTPNSLSIYNAFR